MQKVLKLLSVKQPAQCVLTRFSSTQTANFSLPEYKLHKLDESPARETTLTRQDGLSIYKNLYTIRKMETTANNMYKAKQIRGFCHLYSGQEAIASGTEAALTKEDNIITAYRCHGWALVRGVPVEAILSELTGRRTGVQGGIGGSMHMYTKNFFGGNGIVGAQVPVGAGIALAMKYLKKPNICLSLYGDGASNQGQVFEAYNIAKLWNLPVVFACENNGFGMGTSAERSSANVDYYTRGDYIPGVWVDAMDVLAVRETMRWAKEWCVKGNGPLVIDFATYRYYGHSMSDPGTTYRGRDEVQHVRKTRDPIAQFKERLISSGLCSEAELQKLEKECNKTVIDGQKVAESESYLGIEERFENVYVDNDKWDIRGTNYLEWRKARA